jgi:hypothetical protein
MHPGNMDWPNNLIAKIRKVLAVPCPTHVAPKFIFKLLVEAAKHNIRVLARYKFDLSRALEANKNSPLGYGSKFRHSNDLRKIFGLYTLWPRLEAIYQMGVDGHLKN